LTAICCISLYLLLVADFDTVAYAREHNASNVGAADLLVKWLGPIINSVTMTFIGAVRRGLGGYIGKLV
jgi:hypothetical protein